MVVLTYKGNSICSCCAFAHVNGNASACESACFEHSERLCDFGLDPGESLVVDVRGGFGGSHLFRCWGCGDDSMSIEWPTTIISG